MISSSQRPLPDNTQHSQQTNIHAPGGIRTHDLSKRAAADLRLRPRGHWDRQLSTFLEVIMESGSSTPLILTLSTTGGREFSLVLRSLYLRRKNPQNQTFIYLGAGLVSTLGRRETSLITRGTESEFQSIELLLYRLMLVVRKSGESILQ